jgi:predicted PolB exonuclease-like 3'-5' exonuclease
MHCLVFDIETVPDVDFGRRYNGLDGMDDDTVAKVMFAQRREKTGNEFLPLHQHRIVAISVLLRSRQELRLWTLGEPDSDEAELIQRFYDGVERYSPDLVSWNGSGFDLPLLHYRALRHRISAPRYWETGDTEQSFRWNNYLSRYHWRHTDLMDVLAGFQPRAAAKLDEIAVLLGLPGKLGMSGDQVWPCFLEGGIRKIRDYCETDVLNTFLVYLRFELMRGRLNQGEHEAELQRVRALLGEDNRPHLQAFLSAWEEHG